MIKKISIIAALMTLFVAFGIMETANAAKIDPQNPVFKAQTAKYKMGKMSRKVMLGASSPNYYFGVDVSEHDGSSIDWAKAKKAGVKFAIVRVGCAGWSTGNVFADKYYEKNIKNANKQGIKVGAYIYSQATTKAEAEKEANFITSKLKPLKKYINMPVVWDMESPNTYTWSGSTYKTYWYKHKPSKAKTATNWKAFAKIVKNAGYTPMFYSYTNWVKNNMDMPTLNSDGYPFWLAEYTSGSYPSIYKGCYGNKYPYEMWQYSSTVSVNGIGSDVDVNKWYSKDLNKYTDFTGKATASVNSITYNSAKITWNKVPDATNYKISISGGYTKTVNTTETSYTLNDLKEKTSYKATVTAYKNSDKGTVSNAVAFTTSAAPAQQTEQPKTEEPVQHMKAVKLSRINSSDHAVLKWNKDPQTAKYIVSVSTDNKKWVNKVSTTAASCKLTGLANGKAMYAKVIQWNSKEGYAASSNIVLVHGKLKYTVRDSKRNKMAYKLGNVYYSSKNIKAKGKVTVTAKVNAKSGLVLRKRASSSSKKILTIPYNKSVTVVSQGKTWDKIKYVKNKKVYTGYAYNKYLR